MINHKAGETSPYQQTGGGIDSAAFISPHDPTLALLSPKGPPNQWILASESQIVAY